MFGAEWERVARRMRVINLSYPVELLVPSLIFPASSRSTRGVSFPPGWPGLGIGILLVAMSVGIGVILGGTLGLAAGLVSIWLVGSAGIVMIAGSVRPLAFVKPICVRCRLLPIIEEHEAIHLAGEASEKAVWDSMRRRHSVQSLGLEGDPAICWFCPIPKRLSGK